MRKQKTALQKINWRMGLWLPAVIMLSNPNLHAIDLLPDAIGYALLLVALRRVSALDESFGEVARAFRRMVWLSLARMVGLVWVYTMTSAGEHPTLLLTIAFAIGVLELLTILPALGQLFRGLSYIGTRLDGHIIFETARKRNIDRLTEKLRCAEQTGRWSPERCRKVDRKLRRMARQPGGDITDRMCFSCQLFAVLKTALCALPELAALSQAPYDAGATAFNWYAHINALRAMAWLVASVIGIVWACRVIGYCCRIAKDTPLWENLADQCDEDERLHPERVPKRRLRRAAYCLCVACIFCVDFQIDGINFLPGFITPLALWAALAFLWPYLTHTVRAICAAVFSLGTITTTHFYLSCIRFFTEYDIVLYASNWNVREAYTRYVIDNLWIEVAFMHLMLAAVGLMLCSLIHRYAGKLSMATHKYTSEQINARRRSALRRHLLVPAILGVIMIAYRAVCYTILPAYAMVRWIDFAIAAIFAAFACLRILDVKDELNIESMLAGSSR